MAHRWLAIAGSLLLILTMSVTPVSAAPPSNDGWATPTTIDSLPATISVDLTEATVTDDPQYCGGGTASVWYTYTPVADEFLSITLAPDPSLGAVHIGVDNPFSFVNCIFAGQTVTVVAEAGHTYFLQVASDGSPTTIGLSAIAPIANDRFAAAEAIDSLPATVRPDLTRATTLGDTSACSGTNNGAWYEFTPADDVVVEITADADQSAIVTVTGTTMDELIGCLYSWGGSLQTTLQGGTTYHLMVAAVYPSGAGTAMSIDVAPPPPVPPSNDAKVDAIVIDELPFEVDIDMALATPEAESAFYCFQGDTPTVWYRYEPTVDEVLDADVSGGSGEARAVFFFNEGEGESVGGCTADSSEGQILAHAGTVYYVALGAPSWVEQPVGLTITSTPAPTIEVTVNPDGTVEKVSGTAIISGTAVCSSTGEAAIGLSLRQRVGRLTLITGTSSSGFACGPTASPWTVRVPGDGKPFGVGSVAVQFWASFGDWPLTAEVSGTSTVKLRGR